MSKIKIRPFRGKSNKKRRIVISKKVIARPVQFKGEALYDFQIDDVLKNMPSFMGAIPDSDVFKVFKKKAGKKSIFCFIPNVGFHWVALIFNFREGDIMYYNSSGRSLSETPILQKEIQKIIKDKNPKILLKLKENLVRTQRSNSLNCGLFAINFILDILKNNKSFPKATGFSLLSAERRARVLGKRLKKFGFI